MFLGRTTHPLSRLRTVCDRWEFVSHIPSIRMLTTRQLILPTSPPVLFRSSLTNRSYQSIANFARCYATAKSKPIRADTSKTDDTESPETGKLNASQDTTKSDLMETVRKNSRGKLYNPVDLATSMDYMNSTVYHSIYRGKPVWFYYRRNFKGHFPPPKTRKNCVIGHKLITSNPCPICRDEYLVIDFRNTKLLTQFINPISSDILEPSTTGLCQHQHKRLLVEIEKARDVGTIEMWLPFYLYDYRDYYTDLEPDQLEALLKASGYMPPANNGSIYEPTVNPSTTRLNELPPAVQDILLRSSGTIPHAREYVASEAKTDWSRPRVPNRYKMEEEHKARLTKLRRSRTLLLDV